MVTMAANLVKLAWLIGYFLQSTTSQTLPIIVTTWNTTHNATIEAWDQLYVQGEDLVDSIVAGCSVCELQKGCGTRVGPGDKPDENGEVTQDAMIMDGRTMNVGSVGCLRRIKNAIGVAQAVLQYTEHSLLVGQLATDFAKQMGFPEEDLSSSRSNQTWSDWQTANCQPNFWQNVSPDPGVSCGPYNPAANSQTGKHVTVRNGVGDHGDGTEEPDHDTIGMITIDAAGNAASGTSTNGLTHKIPGRVGDSPIVGAGSFAENGVGAAAATGNGDIMIRLLPSHHAVREMAAGSTPLQAAQSAVARIASFYPAYNGAVIAVNTAGQFGAACHGYTDFPYHYVNPTTGIPVDDVVICV